VPSTWRSQYTDTGMAERRMCWELFVELSCWTWSSVPQWKQAWDVSVSTQEHSESGRVAHACKSSLLRRLMNDDPRPVWANSSQDPISKWEINRHGSVHLSPQLGRKPKIGGSFVQTCLGQKWDLVSKITRAGGMAQVVGHLPSNCKALSTNPSSAPSPNNNRKHSVCYYERKLARLEKYGLRATAFVK
jgi:hypothetical protein